MRLGLGLGLVRLGKAIASFVRDGLKLYYPFKDNSPELLLSGATSFDGSDDYIDFGSDSSLDNIWNGGGTISAWFFPKSDGEGDEGRIIEKRDDGSGWVLHMREESSGTSKLKFYINYSSQAGQFTTNNDVIINQWNHVAVIYDTSGAGSSYRPTIYINGSITSFSATIDTSGSVSSDASESLVIGNVKTNLNRTFDGSIANVGIWNRALSASEIESIYWKGQYADLKGTELTNLVSWYNLSADANDSTGTNNGTNNGATFLTDAYSASSPFLPRIQDKATPKGAVALASGSTSFATDDFVNLGQASNLNFDTDADDFTIAMWFKIASGDTGTLICKGGDTSGDRQYHIYYSSSDYIAVNIGGTVVNTNAYDDGNWHHVAVVNFDDSGTQKFRIYIDGSSVGLGTSGSGSNSLDVLLGARRGSSNSNTAFLFEGSIANVAIYSDAKTQSQIQDIMFSSYSTLTSALKTNLVSWYDLGSTGLSSNKYNSTSGWTAYGNNTIQVNGLDFDITYVNNGNGIFGRYNNNILTSNVLAGAKYEVSFDAFYTGGSAPIVRYYTDAYTTIATLTTESTNYKYIHTPVDSTNDFINFKTNSGNVVSVKNFSFKEVLATDSQGDNEGSIYGATTNTGYTSSPSGVADPLNYGEVYGGNAVSFDGSNDYIDTGTAFSNTNHTISTWVNASATGGAVFDNRDANDDGIRFLYDSNLTYQLNSSDITVSNPSLNTWHHIACTYDGTTQKLYLNGSLVASASTSQTVSVSQNLIIGKQSYSDVAYFNGSINNLKIFNTALTQDQVRELYTKPELTLPTGIASSALKLDMPMQEGSGTAILDGSGNQNHGTGSGITWATGQEYGFQHPLVRSNNPMVFDGADDKVSVGTPSALNNIFTGGGTLSAWINPKSDGQNNAGQAFDKSKYAFQVISESSGNVKVQFAVTLSGGAARWETPLSVPLNTWTHILVTYDSDNPTTDPIIYLNGSAVTLTETIAPSGTHVSDASSNLILGNRNDGVTTFDGLLNDLAIWSSTLTANEATSLYNSGLPLLPTTDSGNYASSDDLVGYWRNDGVTTWLDRSTNSNNGTVSGSPASIIVPEGLNEGRDSQGYYLTDTDSISSGIRLKGAEYISVQDSETLSFGNGTSDTPFSLEAWIKPNDVTNFPALAKGVYNSAGEYLFGFLSVDKLKFYLFNNSAFQAVAYDTALTSSEGQWMHIVATYDGRGGTSANAGMKIYLNGSQVNNANESSGTYVAMENLSANLEVGKYSSNYAKGSIDEAKVYSKELSATEVLKNYNNGKSAHSN